MDLIFLNNPANYRSFVLNVARKSKEYENFFGPLLSSQMSEYKRDTNTIVEHIAKLEEPKSVFTIDDIVKVDFNLEGKTNLEFIIEDFITKLKYKKYKSLSGWIPLLQDHFWNNTNKETVRVKRSLKLKNKAPSKFKPSGLTLVESYSKKSNPSGFLISSDDLDIGEPELPSYESAVQIAVQEGIISPGKGIIQLMEEEHAFRIAKQKAEYYAQKARHEAKQGWYIPTPTSYVTYSTTTSTTSNTQTSPTQLDGQF